MATSLGSMDEDGSAEDGLFVKVTPSASHREMTSEKRQEIARLQSVLRNSHEETSEERGSVNRGMNKTRLNTLSTSMLNDTRSKRGSVSNLSAKIITKDETTFASSEIANRGVNVIDSSTPMAATASVSATLATNCVTADNRMSGGEYGVPSITEEDSSNRDYVNNKVDKRDRRSINQREGDVSYDDSRFRASDHTHDTREDLASRIRVRENKVLETLSATLITVAENQTVLKREMREKIDDSRKIVVDLREDVCRWQMEAEERKQQELEETQLMWSNVHRMQESLTMSEKVADRRREEDKKDANLLWENCRHCK
jgi:hypothetical protein